MISICGATSVSPWASFMRASSTCMSMALRGFFTSCATPPVMRLMAESRSAVCKLAADLAGGLRIAQTNQESRAMAGVAPGGERFESIDRKQRYECAGNLVAIDGPRADCE